MLQATHDMVSAISFIVQRRFSDKRHAGDIYNIGDQFRIVSGPYKGIEAEATRIKDLNGKKYLYAKMIENGQELPFPICFAHEIQAL